jgi:hypothetical protein
MLDKVAQISVNNSRVCAVACSRSRRQYSGNVSSLRLRRILFRMSVTRLGTLFLLAALAAARDSLHSKSVDSSISEPNLPVIETDARPGTRPRAALVRWHIEKSAQMYSSWQDQSGQYFCISSALA